MTETLSSSPSPTPVHMVVDTGVDDALAIVAAALHPAIHLVEVSAAAGNVSRPIAWRNSRAILDLLGPRAGEVVLSVGAYRRADGRAWPARGVHGPDGLAGLAPPSTRAPAGDLPHLRCAQGRLVCCAPLTTLLGLAPTDVLATYARPGEANDAMDPVAARTVRAQWHVTHAPLPEPLTTPTVRTAERLPSNDLAGVVRGLLAHQQRRGAGLGDADAVLRLAGSEDPVEDLLALVGAASRVRP